MSLRLWWGEKKAGRYAALATLPFALALPAGAQTPPGTPIANTAALRTDGATTSSNAVTLIVAERLDVALARTPEHDRAGRVAVTLVNRGSGTEVFVVSASVAGDGATIGTPTAVAPSGDEAPLVEGSTPPLAPGASVVLLVPAGAATDGAASTLAVRAVTGSGSPGTAFAGRGDAGADAVVGPTGAEASLAVAPSADAAPVLEKSQAVAAPDGSATPVVGARVTYSLVARFTAAASEAVLADLIPAGTRYVEGSLALDGTPLTDAGHLSAGAVSVPLGAVAAGAVRTLRFTVVIS